MSRKAIVTLFAAMLLAMLVMTPAMADSQISVVINGDKVKQLNVEMHEGYMVVPVQTWAKLVGADVTVDGNGYWRIAEDSIALAFQPGQPQAILNGVHMTAPAGVEIKSDVYMPLRFAAESFGFEVEWDSSQSQVLLTRQETRDGLTPEQMLTKANQAVLNVDTYTMEGDLQTKFNISVDEQVLPGMDEGMDGDMRINIAGQLQNKPMQAYIKQKMDLGLDMGEDMVWPDTSTEVYMTEQNMYIREGDQGWMVMEMPFGPDFWQEQQQIQSDPLKAVAQMQEWGLLANYGNDTVINGQDYYVLNTSMDVEKFMDAMQEVMQQMMPSLGVEIDADEMAEGLGQLKKILDQSDIDFYYTVYINKDTMFTDIIKMDMRVDLNINAADFASPEELAEMGDVPLQVKVLVEVEGDFTISEVNAPFVAPDVGDAQPISAMMDAVQVIEEATNVPAP